MQSLTITLFLALSWLRAGQYRGGIKRVGKGHTWRFCCSNSATSTAVARTSLIVFLPLGPPALCALRQQNPDPLAKGGCEPDDGSPHHSAVKLH